MVHNEPSTDVCVCCAASKLGSSIKPAAEASKTLSTSGWPENKKVEPPSFWSCTACFVKNASSNTTCQSCSTTKPVNSFSPSEFENVPSGQSVWSDIPFCLVKFGFGSVDAPEQPKTSTIGAVKKELNFAPPTAGVGEKKTVRFADPPAPSFSKPIIGMAIPSSQLAFGMPASDSATKSSAVIGTFGVSESSFKPADPGQTKTEAPLVGGTLAGTATTTVSSTTAPVFGFGISAVAPTVDSSSTASRSKVSSDLFAGKKAEPSPSSINGGLFAPPASVEAPSTTPVFAFSQKLGSVAPKSEIFGGSVKAADSKPLTFSTSTGISGPSFQMPSILPGTTGTQPFSFGNSTVTSGSGNSLFNSTSQSGKRSAASDSDEPTAKKKTSFSTTNGLDQKPAVMFGVQAAVGGNLFGASLGKEPTEILAPPREGKVQPFLFGGKAIERPPNDLVGFGSGEKKPEVSGFNFGKSSTDVFLFHWWISPC